MGSNIMIPVISLATSIFALGVAALTAWLTLLRRGHLMMTQPAVIYFGPDGGAEPDGQVKAKVYLRTLLYSTARRGRIVESMFIRLRRGESTQNFNVWVYGDGKLQRGSGLFIPDTGVASNHHFLLPSDGVRFEFLTGQYELEVFAVLVGDGKKARSLFSTGLYISPEIAGLLAQSGNGLYFDWGSDAVCYHAHVRPSPKTEMPEFLRELIGG